MAEIRAEFDPDAECIFIPLETDLYEPAGAASAEVPQPSMQELDTGMPEWQQVEEMLATVLENEKEFELVRAFRVIDPETNGLDFTDIEVPSEELHTSFLWTADETEPRYFLAVYTVTE